MTQFFYHNVIGIDEQHCNEDEIACIEQYGDILYLPNHKSPNRRHMTIENRAAQFAPFDALTGFKESVIETSRITGQKITLSDEQMTRIDEVLQKIASQYPKHIDVNVIHFVKDGKKSGGSYQTSHITVHQIDQVEGYIIAKDRTKIAFEDILRIQMEESTC